MFSARVISSWQRGKKAKSGFCIIQKERNFVLPKIKQIVRLSYINENIYVGVISPILDIVSLFCGKKPPTKLAPFYTS